ncbi:MAG: nucleoside hydrolase [Planctomycetaceae bacterium]|nr:nucleoside hydrolase [Planctomycetaceae bacterium]
MGRKVILDVDPGIDDAMAICLALGNPDLDVVAVTAVGGNVSPAQATRNVQAIIEQLDPPRWPRLGAASEPDNRLAVDRCGLYGSDGLGESGFVVAERQHLLPSEKVIWDQVRDAPHAVTIICLGPLTNIARVFLRDPEVATLVDRIIMTGGTVSGPGNITPAAEFNMYCDPISAQVVFRSPSTKTLIPLDVTNRVELCYDVFNKLPEESTRVGRLMRQLLPHAFRGYRRQFGLEGIHIHDTLTLMAAVRPELFTTKPMAGDVETQGELTIGQTIFDRRRVPAWRHNMEVAVEMQKEAVIDAILTGLKNDPHSTGGPA